MALFPVMSLKFGFMNVLSTFILKNVGIAYIYLVSGINVKLCCYCTQCIVV